jgi:MFS transporter, OFA family, oxalate/formate antiporter
LKADLKMTAILPANDVPPRFAALIPARYQVLIGAILVQLILGTVYGYSIFWQPLDSVIFPPIVTQAQQAVMLAEGMETGGATVVADEAAKKVQLATQQGYLKYAFSICILSFAVTMVFAGRVQDLRGPRQTAIIGGCLMSMGFITAALMNYPVVFLLAHALLTGAIGLVTLMIYDALLGSRYRSHDYPMLRYVPQAIIITVVVAGITLAQQFVGQLGPVDKVFMLWGTIGFLAGAGIGFAYVCPIAALIKWFPNHKGLVSGLAVAGFGFGAYLFKGREVGALGYIEQNGITRFFLAHGVISLIAITAGAMLLRNPPTASTRPASTAQISSDSTWRDTLRRPAFYLLWLMFFSGALAGLMVIGIIKVFAGDQLVEAALAGGLMLADTERNALLAEGATAVGYLAIFNAVGRVVWGLASDRIGRTPAFVVMFLLQAVTMFVLSQADTQWSLAVIASVVGFNFGGNFALFPSATADLFGAKNLGANYGWVFTSYGIAGVIGIAAGNVAKTMTGSYFAAFALAGGMCLVSAVLAIVLGRLTRKVQTEVV